MNLPHDPVLAARAYALRHDLETADLTTPPPFSATDSRRAWVSGYEDAVVDIVSRYELTPRDGDR